MDQPKKSTSEKQQSYRPTSTAFFRAANFELFVKPNKYVMTLGTISFSLCLFYFYQWNKQVKANQTTNPTYVAINEDETETIRQRKSRWD